MLRYKTETRPGLVALYGIRPGNGAGPFLQPRSPHGTQFVRESRVSCYMLEAENNCMFRVIWTKFINAL